MANENREDQRTEEALRQKSELVQLLQDVAVASNEASNLDQALQLAVDRVCACSGWPVGHVYLLATDEVVELAPTTIWHLDDPERYGSFRKVTESTRLASGVGLPGRVLASGKPAWIMDVTGDSNFPRAQVARDAGVKAGLAFPILVGTDVAGVLEFFSNQAVEPDHALLETMAHVGTQLGRVVERTQAERKLRRYAERLKLLREIDQAILAARVTEGIAQAAVQRIRRLVPCQRASVAILDPAAQEVTLIAVDTNSRKGPGPGETLPLKILGDLEQLRQGKVQITEDILTVQQPPPFIEAARAEGIRTLIHVPMVSEGQLIGTLNLSANNPRALSLEHLDIAREVANQLAVAIHNARLSEEAGAGQERMKTLSQRLIDVQEAERRRIARELHDEIGQALTAVKNNLQALQRAPAATRLQESIGLVEDAIQQVRNLSLDLRPSMLDDLGLVAALRSYVDRLAQRAGFVARLALDSFETRLPADLETVCFRVAQEALTNVVRHAQASEVQVELRQRGSTLELVIRDNGAGFDARAARQRASKGGSFGLLGMEERVRLAGGQIEIESAPKRGTTVRLLFPLPSDAPAPSVRKGSP